MPTTNTSNLQSISNIYFTKNFPAPQDKPVTKKGVRQGEDGGEAVAGTGLTQIAQAEVFSNSFEQMLQSNLSTLEQNSQGGYLSAKGEDKAVLQKQAEEREHKAEMLRLQMRILGSRPPL